MATGRSDYPNQINNVLAFPGVFRGALDVRARTIDEPMKLAAANAIARVIPEDELHADYIIPSVFDRRVAAPSPRRWRRPPSPPAWPAGARAPKPRRSPRWTRSADIGCRDRAFAMCARRRARTFGPTSPRPLEVLHDRVTASC